MRGGELGNGRYLGGACLLKLLTSGEQERDWVSQGKE